MNPLRPYLKIIRPANVLFAAAATALGFWLARSALPFPALPLLILAAAAATGFGNVVNDLRDMASDRISHPERPLPRSDISPSAARFYAVILAIVGVVAALAVSPLHAVATLVPIFLLLLYARFLKGVPLAGNILVSLLVAYALLFGGLAAPGFNRLLIPALLAFLLNCVREIIKDLEDEPGDRAAGIATSARLCEKFLRRIILVVIFTYVSLLYLPFLLHQFGLVYAIICAGVIVPLQIFWLIMFIRPGWRTRLAELSLLIKIELAAGLVALAADQLFRVAT